MATVAYNQWQELDHIYRYDNSAGTFSGNLAGETVFDYFDDDMTAGDYLAIRMDGFGNTQGTKFRDIKIHVETAVAADSIVIKLQYNNNGTWYDVADVTSSFISTGEKEIDFEPPDNWRRATVNGQSGWWARFLVESVTNPTEGGDNSTITAQCGDNIFEVTNLNNEHPVEKAYNYDVANSIGIITKVTNTYIIGKSHIKAGDTTSTMNLNNTNIIFDDSDVYYMNLRDGEVTWVNGYLHQNFKNYPNTSNSDPTLFTNLKDSLLKYLTIDHFSNYDSEILTIASVASGSELLMENCTLNLSGGVYRIKTNHRIRLKNVTSNQRITISGNYLDHIGLTSDAFQTSYQAYGIRMMNFKARSQIVNHNFAAQYQHGMMINMQAEGGVPYWNSASGMGTVMYTYEPFILDPNGNPAKDVFVIINSNKPIERDNNLPSNMNSITTTLPSNDDVTRGSYNHGQVVRIDDELIRIGKIGTNGIVGCVRGYMGTTPASHSSGTLIEYVGDAYIKTGYVDMNCTKEHFLSTTAMINGTDITIFDNQPWDFTILIAKIDSVVSDGTITITGTDFGGFEIKEVIETASTDEPIYYKTQNYFKTISSVKSSGFEGNISIGLYGTSYPAVLTISQSSRWYGKYKFMRDMDIKIEKDGYETQEKRIYMENRIIDDIKLKAEITAGISSGYII